MKKKLVLFAITVVFTLPGYSQKKGFTVTGNANFSNEIYLIEFKNNKPDTLAKAPIIDGTFKLTGQVDNLRIVMVMFKDTYGTMPIFLENEDYVLFSENNPVSGGGAVQQLANQFMASQAESVYKQRELKEKYAEARKANDTKNMEAITKAYDQAIEDAQARENALVKANPNSIVSVYFIHAAAIQNISYETLKSRYELLTWKAKNSDLGKNIADILKKLKTVSIGQIAPDFTLTTPEGGQISLHQIKGKIKLVDFWASWCGPCRKENPNLVALYNEYHSKGLEILGVSLDNDKSAWLKAINDDGLIWQHGSDLQGKQSAIAQLYLVKSIPCTFLLDKNNRIIGKNLSGEELKAKITEFF